MAEFDYAESLRRLLADEGGYTNDPQDPGGPTNFGITIYDYRRYVKPNATAADVRAMTLEEAKGVYRPKYWDAQRCSELPPGVDYATFDYGVNSGIGRSGKVLRRCLSLPDNTSAITDEVVLQAGGIPQDKLITAICDERLRFLKSLRTWPHFGGGWGRRVAGVKTISLRMAQGGPQGAAQSVSPGPGRAVDPDEHGRVRALQAQLEAASFDPGAIDGDLGPKTIKAFQMSRGLKPDGLVGFKTRPLLDAALASTEPTT